MSASLVGSEMCIRDRRPPPRGENSPPGSPAPAPPPLPTGAARHGKHPVSYTHLTLPTICSV
eukprot:13198870-Alexandrium_andersonii.AAC.1